MPKAKAAARRVSVSRTTAKRKAAPKPTRQALQDRTNLPDGHDTEEVDEFEEGDAPAKPQAKRAKTTATRKTVKEDKEDAPVGGAKKSARGRPPKRVISPEPMMTIPETQQDPEPIEEDIEQSIEMDPENMEIAKEPTPKQLSRYAQRAPSVPLQPLPPRPSARAASAQPVFPPIRSRSGSVNAAERRGGDPELRRQLNDLTKRHENLQLKYENLQEIGQTSAETNFERLKRASDQKAKDANELIAALRKEVAELRKTSTHVSSETTALQKQVTTLTATNEKISVERNDLKEKLQLSQNSVKALEAKLQAARQQISNAAQEAKAQEAKKTNAGSLTASDAQKEMKMKENLYADLTGLLISSVKRVDGEDVYNCIQTGRNGSEWREVSRANARTKLTFTV
jgi:FtsZ-binding cell division protein ZapB